LLVPHSNNYQHYGQVTLQQSNIDKYSAMESGDAQESKFLEEHLDRMVYGNMLASM
jgi:hypothetical protein